MATPFDKHIRRVFVWLAGFAGTVSTTAVAYLLVKLDAAGITGVSETWLQTIVIGVLSGVLLLAQRLALRLAEAVAALGWVRWLVKASRLGAPLPTYAKPVPPELGG